MWTRAICFSSGTLTEENEDGIETVTESWGSPIRANFKDLTRDDMILAQQYGFTAEVNVEIHRGSYSGQSYFKDVQSGDIYDVKRSFLGDHKMTVVLMGKIRERGKAVHYG